MHVRMVQLLKIVPERTRAMCTEITLALPNHLLIASNHFSNIPWFSTPMHVPREVTLPTSRRLLNHYNAACGDESHRKEPSRFVLFSRSFNLTSTLLSG